MRYHHLIKRFLEDYRFRTIWTAFPVFLINVAYTVYNGFIGITTRSAWFITMAVYYSLLGVMRYRAVRLGKDMGHSDLKRELSIMKTDGILLLLLNVALSGVVILTFAKDTAKKYPEITVISIAAYTFYKTAMAVIHMIKARRMKAPVLVTLRNIGAADAFVSMFTLQTTMLASFSGDNSLNIDQMNIMTGTGVCILISAIGLGMLFQARKIEKEMKGKKKWYAFL